MNEIIFSLFSLTISAFTLAILIKQFNVDKSRIEFSYEIMLSRDYPEGFIRVYLINTGRRPVLIKKVGYFDWSYGDYISGENKSVEKIINEAEMFYVDEPIQLKDQWRVGRFFAQDHTGKRWISSKKQMLSLYEISHHDGIKASHSIKLNKAIEKKKKSAEKEYIKTIKKIGRNPKTKSKTQKSQ